MADVPQVERWKRIPRRRQGHEYNMMYSCMETCEPNQFHGYERSMGGGMLVRMVHLQLFLLPLAIMLKRRLQSAVEERRAEVGIDDRPLRKAS